MQAIRVAKSVGFNVPPKINGNKPPSTTQIRYYLLHYSKLASLFSPTYSGAASQETRRRELRRGYPSNVEDNLTAGLRAADKRFSWCRWIQRFRFVLDLSRNQRRFAGVADPGPARPPYGHITGFCKFEQAPVFCIPRQCEPTPREGNLRSRPRGFHRQMRRMSNGLHSRCD